MGQSPIEVPQKGITADLCPPDGTVARPKSRVDDALCFLKDQETVVILTVSDEHALLQRIDWMVMPLVTTVYFLQYLDKTLINYANVMGLRHDTHTTTNQFSYLALAFYVGYLVCELPSAYLIQRMPLAKYLGANVILWGCCVTLYSASTNYVWLVVLRVLLGCFESSVAPALIIITSMWYKKKEQPLRVGIWFAGSGLAIVIGALTSFGFQHYHGERFKSWQIMFLVCGLFTIAVGILVVILLPDNPMKSRLSIADKSAAIERLRSNQTGIENKHFSLAQMIEAFRDPRVQLMQLLMVLGSVVNGALSNYQATLIKGFGFTSMQSALLSIPSGFLAILVCTGTTYVAGRTQQRCFILLAMYPLGVIGAALMAFGNGKAAKLAGNYLTNMVPSTPIIYTIAAANVSGHTKKVTVNAMLLISFSVGNIIGPLTFTGNTAPEYIPAKVTIMACFGLAMVTLLALRTMLVKENRTRDNKGNEGHFRDSEFMNLTDRENKEFRYSL